MISKAAIYDIKMIEDTYSEHFRHEMEHGAFISRKIIINKFRFSLLDKLQFV